MNVKTMIEWLSEFPEDYSLCLSEYSYIQGEEGKEEGYIICLDKPIQGLVREDEHKEIRFMLCGDDVVREKGDHIIEIKEM